MSDEIAPIGVPPPTVAAYDDLRWLLERVPAEILILRPAPEDDRRISVGAVNGYF